MDENFHNISWQWQHFIVYCYVKWFRNVIGNSEEFLFTWYWKVKTFLIMDFPFHVYNKCKFSALFKHGLLLYTSQFFFFARNATIFSFKHLETTKFSCLLILATLAQVLWAEMHGQSSPHPPRDKSPETSTSSKNGKRILLRTTYKSEPWLSLTVLICYWTIPPDWAILLQIANCIRFLL